MKKGFTLVELLVVIAIIGILTLIAVPNVIKISKNSDSRLYAQKKENIIAAAELYASNNPDIFQGSDIVNIPVYILLNEGYITPDLRHGEKECVVNEPTIKENMITSGCITNPTSKEHPIINDKIVTVTKKTAGVVGEFDDGENPVYSSEDTLVGKVCEGFATDSFDGKTKINPNADVSESNLIDCGCEIVNGTVTLKDTNDRVVDYCIIVSNKESGIVNNWLKYGASEANWRVLGLYKVDGKISAKMITSDIVK